MKIPLTHEHYFNLVLGHTYSNDCILHVPFVSVVNMSWRKKWTLQDLVQ